MNAPANILRGFRPLILAPQPNTALWTRLGECDRRIPELMAEQDSHATRTGYYAAVAAELDAWRDEQARIEGELRARFASQFGVPMAAFAERLS